MEKPLPIRPAIMDTAFDQLRQALIKHPEDREKLDRFYRHAIRLNAIGTAKATISELQQQNPWNHDLRRRYIALCLQQEDYCSAMEAVETLLAFSTPDDALIDSALTIRSKLGPRTVTDRPHSWPTISLCMIVRNERLFLGPCLNSIKQLADEIIVVDTGSTDRSADMARVFGAHIHNFKWCDDFAAARNLSLEKALGKWILILDADEVIAPQDHVALRGLVNGDPKGLRAYELKTRNYTNLANVMDWQANEGSYPQQEACLGWFPSNKVRLFPRSDRIRFRYPVHELVEPSIHELGIEIVDGNIPIHHYGHVNESRNRKKALQYFDLGYTKLDQLGNDQVALRELAVQAGQLERWAEAIALWHRFLEILPNYGEAYANIAGAYWQLGRYDQGLVYSRKAVETSPDLKEGHYNLAVNYLMTGQIQKAADILKGLIDEYPNYLSAEFMLGAAYCLNDDDLDGQNLFKTLKKKISSQTLEIAIADLSGKLSGSELAAGIPKLIKATGLDSFGQKDPGVPC